MGAHRQYASAGQPWTPPADVLETETEILIFLEVPGIDVEDLSVVQEGRQVIVQGHRTRPNTEDARFHSMEIQYGPFARVFDFPDYLDLSTINASYGEGFLQLRVRKTKKPLESQRFVKIAINKPNE